MRGTAAVTVDIMSLYTHSLSAARGMFAANDTASGRTNRVRRESKHSMLTQRQPIVTATHNTIVSC